MKNEEWGIENEELGINNSSVPDRYRESDFLSD